MHTNGKFLSNFLHRFLCQDKPVTWQTWHIIQTDETCCAIITFIHTIAPCCSMLQTRLLLHGLHTYQTRDPAQRNGNDIPQACYGGQIILAKEKRLGHSWPPSCWTSFDVILEKNMNCGQWRERNYFLIFVCMVSSFLISRADYKPTVRHARCHTLHRSM